MGVNSILYGLASPSVGFMASTSALIMVDGYVFVIDWP